MLKNNSQSSRNLVSSHDDDDNATMMVNMVRALVHDFVRLCGPQGVCFRMGEKLKGNIVFIVIAALAKWAKNLVVFWSNPHLCDWISCSVAAVFTSSANFLWRKRVLTSPSPSTLPPFIILIIFPPITAKYLTSQTFGQLVTFLAGRDLNVGFDFFLFFFPMNDTLFPHDVLPCSSRVVPLRHTTPFIYGPRRRSTLFLGRSGRSRNSFREKGVDF